MTGKAKKIRSFTLVEILIASVIFAVVATIAASSLSMIIATSGKTDDLTASENCVRQVNDYIQAMASSDHYGQRLRVMTLVEENKFQIKEWGKVTEENWTRAAGIAFFDESSVFKIVYKKDGQYLIQDNNTFNAAENFEYSLNSSNSAIHSDDCRFFTNVAGGWDTLKDADSRPLYDFTNPFVITRNIGIQTAQSPTNAALNDSKNRVYSVSVRDVAYRAQDAGTAISTEDDAKTSNIYSRLDLTFSESEKLIK